MREWYPFVWPEKSWFKKAPKEEQKEWRAKVRYYCKTDLFFLAEHVLRDQSKPNLHIGLHDELCFLLQQETDQLNLLPRGHLKSTIGTVAYCLYRIINNPNIRIALFSDTTDIGNKFLSPIQSHIERNKRFKWLFPDVKPAESRRGRPDKWSDKEMIVARDTHDMAPTILAGSTGQTFSGLHCDVIILDDVVTKKTAQTREKLQVVTAWFGDVINVADPGYKLIVNGTRKHDADLYGKLIKDGIQTYRRKHIEDGEYIWPEPQIMAFIEKKKLHMTTFDIATELDNDPIVEGEQDFDPSWFNIYTPNILRANILPEDAPPNDIDMLHDWYNSLNIYMGCDPARSQGDSSDYTVIMVIGVDKKGRMFGLDLERNRYRGLEGATAFVDKFQKWSKYNMMSAKIETYGGDVFFFHEVVRIAKKRGLMYNRVKEYGRSPLSHKAQRIKGLQFPAQNGLIYMPVGGIWDEVRNEFTRSPYGEHDDCIDVMAYIWAEQAKPAREPAKKKDTRPRWSMPRPLSKHGDYAWLAH